VEGAYEAAKRRAAELAPVFAGHRAVTEAELAARGVHPVSVVHGCAETGEDADLIYRALPALAGECGPLAGTRGGNEFSTFLFTGPGADRAAAGFIAAVLEIAPRWWRVTATAHPVWHVEGGGW
jgi:hypothetical protein